MTAPLTSLLRKLGWAVALLLGGAYAVAALRGPQGIPALISKWEEVRDLEKQNAELDQKIREKRDRIRNLRDKESELEIEIRRELNQMKKGEKTLILPESEPALEESLQTITPETQQEP